MYACIYRYVDVYIYIYIYICLSVHTKSATESEREREREYVCVCVYIYIYGHPPPMIHRSSFFLEKYCILQYFLPLCFPQFCKAVFLSNS